MNQIKNYGLLAILAGLLFPSCVATKKYEALEALNAAGMQAEQQCLEQKAGLQTSYNQLQTEKDPRWFWYA